MISITTPDYDLNGCVYFVPAAGSKLRDNARRLSRTATLDGGCSITDQGFSHGDRTLDVRKTGVSENISDTLWYIFRTYSRVRVSLPDGCYSAAIKSVRMDKGELRASILVKELISEG